MKLIQSTAVFLSLLLASALTFAASPYPETDAAKDIEAATADVKEGQLMLLSFGANWCYNCRNLSKELKSAALDGWVNENFQVVKVNVGSSGQNSATVKAFGNPTSHGIPAIVIADAEGNPLMKLPSGQLIPAIRGGDVALKNYLEEAHQEALAKL